MQPNILLIIWDTARAQNLSCYDYERQTSPHLDELAGRSVLFRNAYTVSPWSLPSHASLFTGLYPSQHNVDRRRNNLKDVKTPVLAECLQKLGYQTVGFSNNTWVCGEFGFDRGFDDFFYGWQLVPGKTNVFEINRQLQEAANRLEMTKLLARGFLDGAPVKNFLNGLYSYVAFLYDKGAWLTNKQVQRWLRRDRDTDRPFFMFINYMEPHLKYLPPRAYRRRFIPSNEQARRIRSINQDALAFMTGATQMDAEDFPLLEALYDAEISYLDQRFHELLKLVDAWDALENSIVIVTSDHGENIGDHGLMDHQYCLYETLLKVPLLIRLPGISNQVHYIDRQVEIKDIYFTLLDFLGASDMLAELDLPGHSILSESRLGGVGQYCFAEYLQPQPSVGELITRYPDGDPSHLDRMLRAVISQDGRKFIWASDDRHELYDLVSDPSEAQNLFGSQPGKAQALFDILDTALTSLGELEYGDWRDEKMSPVIRKRLEDLGYM